jgi:hypothetical protein
MIAKVNEPRIVASLDPSGRWRHFAVAACISTANSQQVDLYAVRLRARRTFHPIYAHGRRGWLNT